MRVRDRRGVPDKRVRQRCRKYENGYGRGGRRLRQAAAAAAIGARPPGEARGACRLAQQLPEAAQAMQEDSGEEGPRTSGSVAEYEHDI